MSKKECDRLKVLSTAAEMGRTNAEVAQGLGLSVRQVQRLKKALREEGPEGLAHGNRGRTARHALSPDVVVQVSSLYGGKYQAFNFSHFRDKLAEAEGMDLSPSCVRRILLGAGYRSPRKRRAPKHRSRRERRSCEGAMLQIDGSHHDWLEGRGPRMCLLGAIDDATGKVLGALFREHEDAHGYFLLMRAVVRRHGIPESIYRDRHGIFERDRKEREEIWEEFEGKRAPTQFGRLMKELGVHPIPANSPQAKGRIERLFGTLQDRLVSELRLAGACSLEEANTVLKAVIPEHNRRFCRKPGDPRSVYRRIEKGTNLDCLFCFKYVRCVARDNTVRLADRVVQIGKGPGGRSYAGCRVEVQHRFDDSLHVYYQRECIARTDPASIPPAVIRVRSSKGRYTQECPWADVESWKPTQEKADNEPKPKERKPYKPAPNHPWRRPWGDKIPDRLGMT